MFGLSAIVYNQQFRGNWLRLLINLDLKGLTDIIFDIFCDILVATFSFLL